MGSFVPASYAHIGVVDSVFSRVGASDDQSQGRSTFMVEMVETATIINQATNRSLIILDEIGRGTSTYDGVSIAWGCLEYIHNQLQCRTLFATHYHELTCLQDQLKSLHCYSMKIEEWKGKVIFLHQIIKGASNRSYGIHVAELAGIPKAVVARAKQILSSLEKKSEIKKEQDLPLFSNALAIKPSPPSPLSAMLATLDVDGLTPKEALEILYQLKKLDESS